MSLRRECAARRLRLEQLEFRWALATLYVSTTGNDASDGSAAFPWRSLQHAADAVQAGDTVIVRPGDYVGFYLETDGTAANRIVFTAENGVNITQRNPVTPDGINLEGADYVTIENFTVNNMPRTGIRSVVNHHVIIRNNRMDNNVKWGILTGFSDDILIEGNVTSRSQLEHGIYFGNSADRAVIRNNVSWGNNANGIHMNGDLSMGGDGILSNCLVEGNVIYGNGAAGGSGINCDGVQDSIIRNNLIYDTHASGISLYRIDGGGGSSNNLVVNNTVIVASNGRWAMNIQGGSTGNSLRNNIFYTYHSFRGSIDISPDSLPGFSSDYNVLMNRMTTDGGDSILTLAQWQASGYDLHSLVATPAQLFVNATSDFHLSAGSPAIDAGTSTFAPASDLEGNVRPAGSGFDIGAYERPASAPPANNPPTDITLSNSSVAENVADGTVVGLLAAIDPDAGDSHTYALLNNAGGRFGISGSQLTVINGSLLDYEAATSHSVTVQATDLSGATFAKTFTINIQNVNESPTNITLSGSTVQENASNGTAIGILSASDPDAGDSHSFTLLDSAGSRFAVSGNQLVVADSSLLAGGASHSITVRATDAGGATFDKSFTIQVLNQNQAPTDLTLSSASVKENAANGTTVGTLAAVDPDAGDTHTFTLLNDAGGRFAIFGDQLTVADGTSLNYEAATSHGITVRATDAAGQSFDKSFVTVVHNVNEVVDFDVQRGALQRSYIRYVDLIFESADGLAELVAEGRLWMTRYSLTGTGGSFVDLAGKAAVIGNRVQLDFGVQGIGGSRNSATGDGYYRLRVDTDDDGTFETWKHFYRLLGDTNRDRWVNMTDVNAVNADRGQTGTNLDTDVNGDGVVNSTDANIVKKQRGKSLASWLPLDD